MTVEQAKRLSFLRNKVPLYRQNPVLYANEIIGFTPDDWQAEALMSLAENKMVSVRSGHGVGKTSVEAVALLWFMSCFKFARVVATAPTKQQLNNVLWSEIDKWRSMSPVAQALLTWTKTYVYMNGYEKRWFAVARTASKPENIQGFHADNMLFIVDEASGVEDEIMEAVLATLSGDNNRLLMCGNPTRTTGAFFDSHNKDRQMYKTHKVSSLDSKRTNKENINAFIRKYGESSNVVRVRVYGDFPSQEDDVFLPLTMVEKALLVEIDHTDIMKITLGVDVARYGDDETTIAVNVDNKITLPVVRHGQNLMRTVGDIVQQYRELKQTYPQYSGVITAYIDDTGLGGGVTDRLIEVKNEERLNSLEIVPVNFAQRPPSDGSDLRYENITTYMWSCMRELMKNDQMSLPDDEELVAQLSVRKYNVTSKGKLALESKEEMKKRGIKSPDRADAVGLSCFSTNKIYDVFIANIASIIISQEDLAKITFKQINVGVCTGTTVTGIAFVATGISENYQSVVTLAAQSDKNTVETDLIGMQFAQFVLGISAHYKRMPDYIYINSKETMLIKALRKVLENNKINSIIRVSSGSSVMDRIRLTTRLMAQGRLFLTNDCKALTQAFETAVWSERNSAADQRSDNGITNNGMLNAFEFTIEREANRFIAAEKSPSGGA